MQQNRDEQKFHQDEVLVYAVRHGYTSLANSTAFLVVKQRTLSEILPKLPANIIIPWVYGTIIPFFSMLKDIKQTQYHDRWQTVVKNAVLHQATWITNAKKSGIFHEKVGYSYWCCWCGKGNMESYIIDVMYKLSKGAESLVDLEDVFGPGVCCDSMKSHCNLWKAVVQADISAVPSFDTFL